MTEINEISNVYQLGYADPINKGHHSFCSFAGIDYQVFFDNTLLRGIQKVEFKKTINQLRLGGTLTLIALFPEDQRPLLEMFRGGLVGKKGLLKIAGADEFGHLGYLYNHIIQFQEFNMSIGVDDLVTEYTYDFIVLQEVPIEQPGRHIPKED